MIDQRALDAYLELLLEQVRRGALDCDVPAEGETFAAFVHRKLDEQTGEVPA